jgi:4-amino-4-deoxychorismate lyase
MTSASGRSGTAPEVVLVNGQAHPEGGVSTLDRGLHFGDGLFETIACRKGRACFLSLHLERLALGCERLSIRLADLDVIRREIQSVASGADTALIKLIVTRGEAVARGYGWAGNEVATRIVLRYASPPEDVEAQREGVRVRTTSVRLGENAVLAGMKHLNRLEQVLARSAVPAEDAAELLMFSSSGRLVSGTMSNVFIVQDGRLATPRIDVCGVAGVMRRVVLREAAKAGMVAHECALSADDLNDATEVFLTNARIGIWPVRVLDARTLGPGSTTRKLQSLIAPLLESPPDA